MTTLEERYDAVAELSEIRRLLERILDAVATPFGLIADFRHSSWAAGAYDDVDLGGRFVGLWVRNLSASTIYVGFAPGTGSALRGVVPVEANDDVSIPFACSFVSIGGAADGSAIVAPLLGAAEPGGA